MKKYTSWRYWRGKMQKLRLAVQPRPRLNVLVPDDRHFPLLSAEELTKAYGIASENVADEKKYFDYTVYANTEIRTERVLNNPPCHLTLLCLHNVLCLRNGGLITEDGSLTDVATTGNHGIDISMESDGTAVISSKILPQGPIEVIETPCLHMDVTYFENFGHMLVDGLPRLWALPHIPEKRFGLFISAGWRRLYADELLDAASGGTRIIRGHAATVCRKLYIAIQPHMLGQYVCAQAQAVWRRTGAELCRKKESSGPRRVYFSRRRYAQRPMSDEAKVEDLFRSRGFAVIHPELHPLAEQAAFIRRAEVLAGPYGSALHGSIFGRPELRVFSLCPYPLGSPQLVPYPLLDRAAGRSFAYYLGTRLSEESRHGGVDFPWEAGNITAVEHALDHFLT